MTTSHSPAYADAIASIESAGNGGYGAVGPTTRSGDRAYGRHQVMGNNNIGPWSQAALGKTLTPDQFLADPDAQDAVFQHRFGLYLGKYGNPERERRCVGAAVAAGGQGRVATAAATAGAAALQPIRRPAAPPMDHSGRGFGPM